MEELHQVELLQQLAESAAFMSADDAKVLLPPIYDLFFAQLPLPSDTQENPKIHFSNTEASLIIFHLLAAKVWNEQCFHRATRGILTCTQAPGSLRGICGINVITGQPSSMSTDVAVEKKIELDARLKILIDKIKIYIQQV